MKSYTACALLLLVQLASADKVININNATDQGLVIANRYLTQKGFGVLPLPPLIYDDIQLLKGYLAGVNSMERTQDASLTLNQDSTVVTLDLHLGWSLYDLVFGLIRLSGEEMTGVYRVKSNSFRLSYTLYNQTECRVKLNNYELETLTDASFESSLHGYGGDVSDVFESTVLPRINERLEAKKPRVEQALQAAICRRSFLHLHDPAHLSQILSQVFMHI